METASKVGIHVLHLPQLEDQLLQAAKRLDERIVVFSPQMLLQYLRGKKNVVEADHAMTVLEYVLPAIRGGSHDLSKIQLMPLHDGGVGVFDIEFEGEQYFDPWKAPGVLGFIEAGSLRFVNANAAELLDAAGIIRSDNVRSYNIRRVNVYDVAYNLRTGMSWPHDKEGFIEFWTYVKDHWEGKENWRQAFRDHKLVPVRSTHECLFSIEECEKLKIIGRSEALEIGQTHDTLKRMGLIIAILPETSFVLQDHNYPEICRVLESLRLQYPDKDDRDRAFDELQAKSPEEYQNLRKYIGTQCQYVTTRYTVTVERSMQSQLGSLKIFEVVGDHAHMISLWDPHILASKGFENILFSELFAQTAGVNEGRKMLRFETGDEVQRQLVLAAGKHQITDSAFFRHFLLPALNQTPKHCLTHRWIAMETIGFWLEQPESCLGHDGREGRNRFIEWLQSDAEIVYDPVEDRCCRASEFIDVENTEYSEFLSRACAADLCAFKLLPSLYSAVDGSTKYVLKTAGLHSDIDVDTVWDVLIYIDSINEVTHTEMKPEIIRVLKRCISLMDNVKLRYREGQDWAIFKDLICRGKLFPMDSITSACTPCKFSVEGSFVALERAADFHHRHLVFSAMPVLHRDLGDLSTLRDMLECDTLPIQKVVEHLVNVTSHLASHRDWSPSDDELVTDLDAIYAFVGRAFGESHSETAKLIIESLQDVPFIRLSDGRFVTAHEVCLNGDCPADDVLGPFPAPPTLKRFRTMMIELGAADINDGAPIPKLEKVPGPAVVQLCMFDNNDWSPDTQIGIEGQTVLVHRFILELANKRLADRLRGDWRPDNIQEGQLHVMWEPDASVGLAYRTLYIFLRYLYSCSVEIEGYDTAGPETQEMVENLLRLSNYLLDEYVKSWCECWLSHKVTRENCCHLLSLADITR